LTWCIIVRRYENIDNAPFAIEIEPAAMSAPSYAIIGTGAIGGFYGSRLQKAGLDVHFLLRSDYDTVRDRGLSVESPEGDFTLDPVNAYNDVAKMPRCDVVVVSLKTTQNHLLPKLLPPVVKPDGVVLVLQNGLGIEDEVAKIVGSDRVMGGMCFICANKIAPGRIRHLDYSAISLADYDPEARRCGVTDRMKRIATDFERAGIPIQLMDDLLMARWHKLVWNIPYNGLSVVLDAQTDELMGDPSTRQLVEQLMRETVAGAAGCDRAIPDSTIQKMLDRTDKMKPYLTSMKLDYNAKRPLELEAIFGNPVRMANAAGVSLPRVEMLYRQLQFLDRKNRQNHS
jgi:2-dehydropantoate 2-reductase